MKRFLVTMFLIFTGVINSQEWYWQNPIPQGKSLNSVYFVTSETGWGVGKGGTIVKTTDGGDSWNSPVFISPTLFLKDVSFTNQNNGIAVGMHNLNSDAVILRTTNGGSSWNQLGAVSGEPLNSVSFADANTGISVGNSGLIAKTTNGGASWNIQTSPTNNIYYDIHLIDANTGTAAGTNGTVIRTTNGGTVWNTQTSGTTNTLNSVFFVDVNTGYIVGEQGIIIKTTNGGTTWIMQSSGVTSHLMSVAFTDVNNGSAAGLNGVILSTTNGGITWTSKATGTSDNLNSIYFPDNNYGIAAGDYGTILITTNGGNNWVLNSHYVTKDWLEAVNFIDENIGAAVGSGGTIVKTTNGGLTWSKQSSGTSLDLYDIYFANENLGIAVGGSYFPEYNGIILRTTNGGSTWISQPEYDDAIFYAVTMLNENIGYAGGLDVSSTPKTFILKTTNGGSSWVSLPNPGQSRVNAVKILNINTVVVTGGFGFLKSSDGGATWDHKTFGFNCVDIEFTTPLNGFIVGQQGTIIKTTDGGNNWFYQDIGTDQDLNGVSFSDASHGIIVGYGYNPDELSVGLVLKTTDGGATWVTHHSSSIYLTDVSFIGNTATVVGNEGAILRLDDAGVPVELVSFTASVIDRNIVLEWDTATELNNKGFEVQKKINDEFQLLSFIPGYGTTTDPRSYQYIDENVTSGIYSYRLKQIDYDGTFEYSDIIKIEFDNIPVEYALYQNYPNPFNPSAKIKFEIPVDGLAELKIYDILGREVFELVNEVLSAGTYEKTWNAHGFASGIYYYKLKTESFSDTKKMLLMK